MPIHFPSADNCFHATMAVLSNSKYRDHLTHKANILLFGLYGKKFVLTPTHNLYDCENVIHFNCVCKGSFKLQSAMPTF